MAKILKRWVVVDNDDRGYRIFVGRKPVKPKGGWCRLRRRSKWMSPYVFEWLFPEPYHLLTGPTTGPVLIEFKETT